MADHFMTHGGNAAQLIQHLQGESPLLWQLNLGAGQGPNALSIKPLTLAEFLAEHELLNELTFKQRLVTIVRTRTRGGSICSEVYLEPHITSLNSKYTTTQICPAYVWGDETEAEPSIFVVHPEGYVQFDSTYFYEVAAFARYFGMIDEMAIFARYAADRKEASIIDQY